MGGAAVAAAEQWWYTTCSVSLCQISTDNTSYLIVTFIKKCALLWNLDKVCPMVWCSSISSKARILQHYTPVQMSPFFPAVYGFLQIKLSLRTWVWFSTHGYLHSASRHLSGQEKINFLCIASLSFQIPVWDWVWGKEVCFSGLKLSYRETSAWVTVLPQLLLSFLYFRTDHLWESCILCGSLM